MSQRELVNICCNMKLCQYSVSAFSEREEFFLREIDLMYNLPIKHKHTASMPTRPTDLLHWRMITEILAYTRDRGAITSSTPPRKLIPLIDTRCDLIREYKLLNHHSLLFFFPPVTSLVGRVRMKAVIAEIVDPRQLGSPAYKHLRRDPMVKLTFGIRPDVIQLADRVYIDTCAKMANSIQLSAVGPVGIDLDTNHVLMDKQISVFKEFVSIANVSVKPLRIYYTRNFDISIDLAEKGLPRGHPVHLVYFTGDYREAKKFKEAFTNGYLGISEIACNPPPYFIEVLKYACIDRLVLESNAPYNNIGTNQKSHTTDIAKILVAVANIKDINVDIVAKYLRRNNCALYKF